MNFGIQLKNKITIISFYVLFIFTLATSCKNVKEDKYPEKPASVSDEDYSLSKGLVKHLTETYEIYVGMGYDKMTARKKTLAYGDSIYLDPIMNGTLSQATYKEFLQSDTVFLK